MLLKAVLLSVCLKIKILLCEYSTYQETQELGKFVKKKKWWFEGRFGGKIVVVLYFIVAQNKFLDTFVIINIL